MKKPLLTVIAMLGTLVYADTSHAGFVSGNICSLAINSTPQGVSLSPYGATNISTSNQITVNCALPVQDNAQYVGLKMFAYDRNTTQNVNCTESGFDANGNFVDQNSFSTSGGGPNTNLQTIGPITIGVNARIITVQCTIPPGTVSGGVTWVSHVVGFQLIPPS
jgi:hypothetical protein